MSLSFPANPTVGQIYQGWVWTGAVWNPIPGPQVGVSDGGYVNKLRNGTFDVWQRGYPVACPVNMQPYTADGWLVQFLGASSSVSRSTVATPPGLGGFGQLYLYGEAGVTQGSITQRVESYLAASLAGQVCTIQFAINNFGSAAFVPQLTCITPTAQDNYASYNTVFNKVPLQSVPAGGWTRVAYTFAMPMSAQNGANFELDFPGSALNSTSNNIAIASADLRATPNLPTGLCPNPPPPELRPISAELAFCQRYYVNEPTWGPFFMGYVAATGTAIGAVVRFPVVMRAAPTVTLTNNSGYYFPDTPGTIAGGPTTTGFMESRTSINGQGNAGQYWSGYTASAEL